MKIKLNRMERVAGIFVASALGMAFVTTIGVAIQKGWFAAKVTYKTVFEQAEGLFPGSHVEVAGLRAGSVDSVDLQTDNKVVVTFTILEKFSKRIRSDSVASTKRPFIIGDKLITISVGSLDQPQALAGSILKSEVGMDLFDLADPRKYAPFLNTFSKMTENLRVLAEAFADPKRTEALIRIFDKIDPFLSVASKAAKNVSLMSEQMTKDRNLEMAVENLVGVTNEMNSMFKEMPGISHDMAEMIKNTSIITAELSKVMPALSEVAPQLPQTTKRMVEAIDEAVVVLKAMQKSFLLSGSAKEVRKEEEEKRKKAQDEEKREPASIPQMEPEK